MRFRSGIVLHLLPFGCRTIRPSLIYPIAYDFGKSYESTGKAREAATLYSKAKATIEQMATAVEDEALRSTFLQSVLVQEIYERTARLGG